MERINIERQNVLYIDGCLRTTVGDGKLILVEAMSNTFWWYGPIPNPPYFEEAP